MSEAWIKALQFAALPGAAKIVFERQSKIEDGTPTVHYRLQSMDGAGKTIGDDRDYDLLKAVMSPLEKLAEARSEGDFHLELDLKSGKFACNRA